MKIFMKLIQISLFFTLLSCQEKGLIQASEGAYNPEMVFVEGGEMVLGYESYENNPSHKVNLSSFYMSKYMVTIKEWKEFLQDVPLPYEFEIEVSDPYYLIKDIIVLEESTAVMSINWFYAVVFCNWASLKDNLEPAYEISSLPVVQYQIENDEIIEDINVVWNRGANGYRLATAAEWEYAARGGQLSEGYFYPGSNEPHLVMRNWYDDKIKKPYPVGQLLPNELGIHDMAGLAEEWCWDWDDEEFFEWIPEKNPSVDSLDMIQKHPKDRNRKRLGGGQWLLFSHKSSLVYKIGSVNPYNAWFAGIRLVRNAEVPQSSEME